MKKKAVVSVILALAVIAVCTSWFFLPQNTKTDLKGGFYRLIGRDVIPDPDDPKYSVMRLEGDYLTFAGQSEDISPYISKLCDFGTWVENQGVPFLYLQTPHKVPFDMETLPNGEENFFASNGDAMLSALQEKGLDTYDLKDEIHGYGKFFKTDHHWLPQTGLEAAKLVLEKINELYNLDLDSGILDPDNFEYSTYEKCFLGSQGKKVGKYYAGIDDFTVITPDFETSFYRSVPIMGIEENGSFEDCFSDYSLLENTDIYTASPYVFYTSDYSLEICKNLSCKNGAKILILRDSFGCVLTPFMSLGIEELHVVDTRQYKESLYDYIEQNDFDLVIFESNPGFNRSQFTFIKDGKTE